MDDKIHMPLSDSEQLLIMRFFDGECGFLERSKAQRLIEKSQPAAQYFTLLQTSADGMQTTAQRTSVKVDLWDEVSRRIAAEEHAALFLGKRETHDVPNLLERMQGFLSSSWNLGVSGAVVAAGAALFFVIPTNPGTNANTEQMVEMARGASFASTDVQPVGIHGRPQILDEQEHNVVEVDWMRSDGRLRMLHEPSERSAIIWVKRRNPTAQVKQNRRRAPVMLEQSTPFGIPVLSK